jgi:hypothetical protein
MPEPMIPAKSQSRGSATTIDCDVCGRPILSQDEFAGYGGPYGGESWLLRLRYRKRHFVGKWHIVCRPAWANPWREGGSTWVYGRD